MRRSRLPGQGQFVLQPIDGDYRVRADEFQPEHHAQSHAAQAEDGCCGAGLHPGGVHHRADTGHDCAAEQCRHLKRIRLVDFYQRLRRGHGELRVAGHTLVMVDRLASAHAEAPTPVQQPASDCRLIGRLAKWRAAHGAHRTPATARNERKHHVIVRLEPLHAGADVADNAGRLVPHHHRHRARA